MSGTAAEPAAVIDAIPRGSLAGQVALITGASRGLGRAIATELARAGANIVVNHRDSAGAAAQVAGAVESEGAQALVVQADVGDPEAVQRMYAAAVDRFGRAAEVGFTYGLAKNVARFGCQLGASRRARICGPTAIAWSAGGLSASPAASLSKYASKPAGVHSTSMRASRPLKLAKVCGSPRRAKTKAPARAVTISSPT